MFIFLSFNLYAIEVNEKSSGLDVLSNSYVFLDKTNSLTREETLREDFIANTTDSLGLGIVPDTALWIKFTLKNVTDKKLYKLLEYDNPETEDLLFYYDDKVVIDGMFHHRDGRSTLNPVFEIRLKPYEEKTFYVKAHCKISTLIAKLTLWDKIDFLRHDYEHKIYIFVFFAIIATLLIYNLTLLVFTKDVIYFHYVSYLGAMLFFESVYLGVAQLYFFSNEVSIFVTQGTIGYITMMVVPMILFAMEFLNTKRFKRIHLFLKSYLYLLPIVVILSFDNFLFNLDVMLIFFPLVIVLIFAGFLALSNGTKEAKYYLIGWSFVITSLVLSVLKSLGGYDVFQHFLYINELAFVLEAIIFSIALAYRINLLSEKIIQSDKKLILFHKEEQNLLETLVSKKTKDLRDSLEEKEVLYKELNHRVKNNLQMILSLVKLQINQTRSQNVKEELIITKNRINSIANLYELLHLKGDSNYFNTRAYFKNIVQAIQENFKKNVNVNYKIQRNLKVEDSIYCGLILNELVTNSFKYAFEQEGNVEINVFGKDDVTIMSIQDDGNGFDEKNENSLGLTIVQTLAEKQLQGTLEIESRDGTKATITWRENE